MEKYIFFLINYFIIFITHKYNILFIIIIFKINLYKLIKYFVLIIIK